MLEGLFSACNRLAFWSAELHLPRAGAETVNLESLVDRLRDRVCLVGDPGPQFVEIGHRVTRPSTVRADRAKGISNPRRARPSSRVRVPVRVRGLGSWCESDGSTEGLAPTSDHDSLPRRAKQQFSGPHPEHSEEVRIRRNTRELGAGQGRAKVPLHPS